MQAKEILTLAAKIKRGDEIKPGSLTIIWDFQRKHSDWLTRKYMKTFAEEWVLGVPEKPFPESTTAQEIVTQAVNEWLRWGDTRLGLHKKGDGFSITLDYRRIGLFGHLAFQLMLMIGDANGIAICSSCFKFYSPSRIPRRDQNNYCAGCGKLPAWRNAKLRNGERKNHSVSLQILCASCVPIFIVLLPLVGASN